MGGQGGSLWSCEWERVALFTVPAVAHESIGVLETVLVGGGCLLGLREGGAGSFLWERPDSFSVAC